MYRRPNQKYKLFLVESVKSKLSARGRKQAISQTEHSHVLIGVLADAEESIKYRYKQESHVVTHTIVQKGSPAAKIEENLIFENRIFRIWGIQNVGELDVYTLYHCEERYDLNG